MVREHLQQIETSSIQVSDMVNIIIGDATKEIDTYIDKIRHIFITDTQILDNDLDKIMLQIPVHIYYLVQVLQTIDIKKGVSAETAKYQENDALLQATGTVADKQAKASNATIKDRVVQLAFKNASALIQAKINAAMEILSSAKRVQQRRLEEMKLTKLAGNSVATF